MYSAGAYVSDRRLGEALSQASAEGFLMNKVNKICLALQGSKGFLTNNTGPLVADAYAEL